MGNNKCKPVDFDMVETLVANVPIDSLSFEDKRRVVEMLKDTIIAGKDNVSGFDVPGLEVHITPYTTVTLNDAIAYTMYHALLHPHKGRKTCKISRSFCSRSLSSC